jgi:hypothetical protein
MWSTPKRARDMAARALPSIRVLFWVESDSAIGASAGRFFVWSFRRGVKKYEISATVLNLLMIKMKWRGGGRGYEYASAVIVLLIDLTAGDSPTSNRDNIV